jgi:hypothetical protein
MKKMGDGCEEVKMQFWDCNPYVSVNQGHMMFAKRKISALDGNCEIACKTSNASFEKMVYAYTETSIGMFEALLVVGMKYRSNVIRPETVINQYIDEN